MQYLDRALLEMGFRTKVTGVTEIMGNFTMTTLWLLLYWPPWLPRSPLNFMVSYLEAKYLGSGSKLLKGGHRRWWKNDLKEAGGAERWALHLCPIYYQHLVLFSSHCEKPPMIAVWALTPGCPWPLRWWLWFLSHVGHWPLSKCVAVWKCIGVCLVPPLHGNHLRVVIVCTMIVSTN